MLATLLAPPIPHQTQDIYISLEMYSQGEANGICYVAREEVPMEPVYFYLLAPFPAKMVISRGSGPGRPPPLGPLHEWRHLSHLCGVTGHLGWYLG